MGLADQGWRVHAVLGLGGGSQGLSKYVKSGDDMLLFHGYNIQVPVDLGLGSGEAFSLGAWLGTLENPHRRSPLSQAEPGNSKLEPWELQRYLMGPKVSVNE